MQNQNTLVKTNTHTLKLGVLHTGGEPQSVLNKVGRKSHLHLFIFTSCIQHACCASECKLQACRQPSKIATHASNKHCNQNLTQNLQMEHGPAAWPSSAAECVKNGSCVNTMVKYATLGAACWHGH
jgi:hypothetical protein